MKTHNNQKDMAYAQEFLDEMKKRLSKEQAELEKELGSFGKKKTSSNYESSHPDFGTDSDENAQEVTGYAENLSQEAVLEKRLARVQKALARMDDGSYGMCDGAPTSQERLEADPSAGALESRAEME